MTEFSQSTGVAHLPSTEPGPAIGRKENNAHTDLKDAFEDFEHDAFTSPTAASAVENPLQVVFSFDTTGSMSRALGEVRARLSELLRRLQTDFPGITIAVVAHGDYCDAGDPYITKHIDFTNDLQRLVEFVNDVEDTDGGDFPEAYEVMLRLVRKGLSWNPGSRRILVVIGDAYPHPPGDIQNKDKIDWKKEALLLKKKLGVRIYGIQVDHDSDSTKFFQKLTKITEGQRLNLSEFEPLCDTTMAICYREKGPEYLREFEAEIREHKGSGGLHVDLNRVFKVLRHHAASFPIVASATECQEQTKTKKKMSREPNQWASYLKTRAEIYLARLPRRSSNSTRKDLQPKSPWPQPESARTPRKSAGAKNRPSRHDAKR